MTPTAGAVADLVRLPSVLSVPGDVLLGTAASGRSRSAPEVAGLVAASSCLYLAGMTLNDYADREVDARERPSRPIPSGRVQPRFALRLAAALTAAGIGAAAAAGGRRTLEVAVPLAIVVWAYDLVLKNTPVGPPTMASCRVLDVLMGSGRSGAPRALAPAAAVGAHTLLVTAVSRQEATGAGRALPLGALAATAALTAAAAALIRGDARKEAQGASERAAIAYLALYAASLGRAGVQAARDPSPSKLQRFVGRGVLGLMPLEAALLSAAGAPVGAAGVGALWPLAARLARRRSVT